MQMEMEMGMEKIIRIVSCLWRGGINRRIVSGYGLEEELIG
jgi:hypothetical protein